MKKAILTDRDLRDLALASTEYCKTCDPKNRDHCEEAGLYCQIMIKDVLEKA